ncbi:MAG TPA: amino acid permease [Anaerolineae bacterium]|nr:amino acid permease [Anaerolineae bacterium]
MAQKASANRREEVTLSRTLGLFSITMIGVGGMIGAGIFALTGIAAGEAGPALILVFALNGVVTTMTAMAYAELGSAFPEAGGGYLWVKEAIGGAQGFLAGWMNWFAPAVAGSLYALTFGRFAAELFVMADWLPFGLSVEQLTLALMTLVIALFTVVNYRGASETGKIGNVVTMTKILILGLLVLFGIAAMLGTAGWQERFTVDFLPEGLLGVAVAMGLTFIAFEGYEIIAQSGEEVVDPKRNIPRAIFIAIGIAVSIYILVGLVSIGSVVPPEGLAVHEYLGAAKEVAIVEVARQTFPWGMGALVLLLSGLASTMSALNAATYSASRVSFAMGRDHNLPTIFAQVHPVRHTPYWAVLLSGLLMLLMAWLLPIEDLAAAASIMFLLLFLQVNVAVLLLRRKRPDLERGFKIPWFPAIPVIAILCNALLAVYLFTFSPIGWYFAIGWIIVGLLAYYTYFSRMEAMEKPKEILLEEVLISREYSVLVPVANPQQARILGGIGAILAQDQGGELLALHVVEVPPQLSLGEGRLFLKEGRANLDEVIRQGKARDVPVHTIIRLGRTTHEAVTKTALENASDLIVLGWPGHTSTAGRLFGSVIDPIIDNPPTDVALVRIRQRRPLRSVLVPIVGGPNSRKAVQLAVAMAEEGEEGPATVKLLHVLPPHAREATRVRAQRAMNELLEGIDYEHVETMLVESNSVVEPVVECGNECDLIVVGATEEPLFKNLLVGRLTERIARQAKVTVVMVKRRSGALKSWVRQTLLEPTVPKPLE